MSADPQPHTSGQRVRVWLGMHLISEYVGDPDAAVAYESGMRGRYISLRISNEPATSQVAASNGHRLGTLNESGGAGNGPPQPSVRGVTP